MISLPRPAGATKTVVTCISDSLTDRSGYAGGFAKIGTMLRALRWRNNGLGVWEIEVLGSSTRDSVILGINNNGDGVGWETSLLTRMGQATLWTVTRLTVGLGTLGGRYSSANAINNFGVIVGHSEKTTNSVRPFVYRAGLMRDFTNTFGYAYDINDSGQIGGALLFLGLKPAIMQEGRPTIFLSVGRGSEGEVRTVSPTGNAGGSIKLPTNRTAAVWVR